MLVFGSRFFASRTTTALYLGLSVLNSSVSKPTFAFALNNNKHRFTGLSSASTSSTNSNSMSTTAAPSDTTCSSSVQLEVVQLPCLSDNYGYLIHDAATGQTAAIDTPDARPYIAELEKRNWKLTHIFNTHHHHDHTGGNIQLKTEGVQVYGPATENIPGRDVGLHGDDEIIFGSVKGKIIDVGGHTKGHIAYYFPSAGKLFVGDSLFALGCGRMFEGTPEQFWTSLQRLRQLPDETLVYCAHEYTLSNAKFAVSVEPGNKLLLERYERIKELRDRGEPTVPSRMGDEKATNPFLRCDKSSEIQKKVGVVDGDTDFTAFAKVRKAKDNF